MDATGEDLNKPLLDEKSTQEKSGDFLDRSIPLIEVVVLAVLIAVVNHLHEFKTSLNREVVGCMLEIVDPFIIIHVAVLLGGRVVIADIGLDVRCCVLDEGRHYCWVLIYYWLYVINWVQFFCMN